MIYILLLGSCIVVIELFHLLHLGREARGLVHGAHESLQTLARADVSDEAKERFAREASVRTLQLTAAVTLKLFLIGTVLYALYRVAVFAVPAVEPELTRSFASPAGIAVLTFVGLGYVLLRNAVRKHL